MSRTSCWSARTSSSAAMGSWMAAPPGAVWTVMFRPRLRGIEMKLTPPGAKRELIGAWKSRGAACRCLQRLEDQAHVERRRGVRQGAHAYEVDAGFRDCAYGFQRDAARCLQLGAAGHERNRRAQLIVGHVVEQDPRRARF